MGMEELLKNLAAFKQLHEGTTETEREVEMAAVQSKATYVLSQIRGCATDEDFLKLKGSISDVIAILIPQAFPTTIMLAHMEGIFELVMTTTLIGYYCGKTGDFMEGV